MPCGFENCGSPRDCLVLISTFLVYMNAGMIFINGLLVTELLATFEEGETLTTWVVSLQLGLALFLGFLSGSLVELYGCRLVAYVGTLIAASGYVFSAFSSSLGLLFLTYSVITGVGLGIQHIPCLTVPQLVFTNGRVLATAFVLAGSSSGSFLYPVLFNYFRELYGWRGAMLLIAGIIFNSVPLTYLMTSHPDMPDKNPVKNSFQPERTRPQIETPNPDIKNKKPEITKDRTSSVVSSPIKMNGYATPVSISNDDIHKMTLSPSHRDGMLHQAIYNSSLGNSNGTSSMNRHAMVIPEEDTIETAPTRSLSATNESGDTESMTYDKVNGVERSLSDGRKSNQKQQEGSLYELPRDRALSELSIGFSEAGLRIPSTSMCEEFRRILGEMRLGFLELRDGSCVVVLLVVCIFAGGYQVPYIFLPIKTSNLGHSKPQGARLISIIGIADTVARLLLGLIANIFRQHIPLFYGLSMLACTAGCVGMALGTTYGSLQVCCVIFGAGAGGFSALYTQSAIVIVGLSKILRMLGLMAMAWAIAFLASPPLSAFIYETTGNLDIPFWLSAALQLLSTLIHVLYRFSPCYKTRPGALEEAAIASIEDLPLPTTTDGASIAPSHSTLRSGSHVDSMAWQGSVRSVRSRLSAHTPRYMSAVSLNTLRSVHSRDI